MMIKSNQVYFKGLNRYYRQSLAVCALLVATTVWGSTFFLIKDLLSDMSTLSFLAIRFLASGILVGICFFSRLCRAPKETWIHGFGLGFVYASAQIFQTKGLESADASVVGFITGLYVVLTPLLVWLLFREKIKPINLAAAIIALAGLMVLSLKGLSIGIGETITLIGAILFSLHIVLTARWATRDNPLTLAAVQLIALGLFCPLAVLPFGITLPHTASAWVAIAYTVVFAAIGALILQTWAQSQLRPTKAAVVMTMEPVFAAFFAVFFGGEDVTMRMLIGGALVLVAMLITELIPAWQARDKIRLSRKRTSETI